MIHNEQRAALAAQLVKGDLIQAVKIYEKIAKRKIHRSMLEKFVENLHPFRGDAPGSHDPLQMYQAIAQAIAERQQREREATQKAADLLQTILRDTKPTQPIAL